MSYQLKDIRIVKGLKVWPTCRNPIDISFYLKYKINNERTLIFAI